MGAASDKLRSCCAHGTCEAEQFTDKIQLAPIQEDRMVTNSIYDSTTEKNKEIIASHIRPPSKIPNEFSSLAQIRIPPEEISLGPILKIRQVKSVGNSHVAELEINAQGLIGSLRNAKDGIVYFGSERVTQNKTTKSEPYEQLNDFIIPIKEAEMAERHFGRHFQIAYDVSKKKYFMRDLGKGFGVFIRIDYPQVFFIKLM